jgi:hypothetical protein
MAVLRAPPGMRARVGYSKLIIRPYLLCFPGVWHAIVALAEFLEQHSEAFFERYVR